MQGFRFRTSTSSSRIYGASAEVLAFPLFYGYQSVFPSSSLHLDTSDEVCLRFECHISIFHCRSLCPIRYAIGSPLSDGLNSLPRLGRAAFTSFRVYGKLFAPWE